MPPSDKVLEGALANAVRETFYSPDRDLLSVNMIRNKVQEQFDLDDGFFKTAKWKDRSKSVIKEQTDELMNNEETGDDDAAATPEPSTKRRTKKEEPTPERKKPIKRQSSKQSSPSPKRRKQESSSPPPRRLIKVKKTADSELSDFEDEKPSKKTAKQQHPARRLKRKKEEDSEDESKASRLDPAIPSRGRALAKDEPGNEDRKSRNSAKKESEDRDDKDEVITARAKKEESVKNEVSKHEDDSKHAGLDRVKPDDADSDMDTKSSAKTEVKPRPVVDSSSELSDVLDEPPKKSRKKKATAAGDAKKPKPKTVASSSSSSRPAPAGPDEAEIKKLQSHLSKCGVRKIWGIELKKFGDDSRAKISHLRSMLRDVGMEGRFSEARAREIKEQRELMADLEAVTEMNRAWGADDGRPRRARREVRRSLREPDSDDDNDDMSHTTGTGKGKGKKNERENGDGDSIEHGSAQGGSHGQDAKLDESEDDEEDDFVARPRRSRGPQAELAFLDDDSDLDD